MKDLKRVYVASFYQVRKMRPWEAPMSTAVYSPKWFNENKGPGFIFLDKNNVLNGLLAHHFVPNDRCHGLCAGQPCKHNPDNCEFLMEYSAQLAVLDPHVVMHELQVKALLGLDQRHAVNLDLQNGELEGHQVQPVLLLHEAPNNRCSERVPIMRWFHKHGVQCVEWTLERALKMDKKDEKEV